MTAKGSFFLTLDQPGEVERLLRLIQTPPALLGEVIWARSALGICEHLAQVYGELRRRYGARGVRVAVQQLLCAYVTREGPEEVQVREA